MLSNEMVKLEDGTPAAAYTIEWTWTDGVTKLQTAGVTAFKRKKCVIVSATTVLGEKTKPETLLEMCRSLKFY